MKLKSIIFFVIVNTLLVYSQNSQPPITISVKQLQIPVLRHKEVNPVIEIEMRVFDTTKSFSVDEISFSARGTTDMNDIESASLFYYENTQNNDLPVIPEKAFLFAKIVKPGKQIVFKGSRKLRRGNNYFCFSYRLADNANIMNVVSATCLKINTNFGAAGIEQSKEIFAQPIGIALRKHNDDSVHTYRIPGLAVTNKGTLLASFDMRNKKETDLQGDIDIGIARSTDGGNTWSKTKKALDMKNWGNLPEKFNGVSDACLLVDKNSDNIFLAGLWMHGVLDEKGRWIDGLTDTSSMWNHQWLARGSQPGFDIKETSQFLIAKSTDDGLTWSEPVNITKMCKKENWWLFAPSPGNGITMKNGTLVFPTQGRDSVGNTFSNIIYSTDGGIRWKVSEPAQTNTTECAVVELDSNILLLNMRDNRNRTNTIYENGRAAALSKDMGNSWSAFTHNALTEPVCMASLLKHEYREDGENRSILLFSNPNSAVDRSKLTIKISFDRGMTWPEEYWLLLDERIGRGYSSMTSINEHTIGILYEGSQADLVFQKISLSEILKKTE